MSNLLVNERDQEFLLFEQLGIEKLFQTEAFKDFSKDDALLMLAESRKLAVNVILPTYTLGDREGCTFEGGKVTVPKCYHDAFKKYVEGKSYAELDDIWIPKGVWGEIDDMFNLEMIATRIEYLKNHVAFAIATEDDEPLLKQVVFRKSVETTLILKMRELYGDLQGIIDKNVRGKSAIVGNPSWTNKCVPVQLHHSGDFDIEVFPTEIKQI